MILKKNSFLFPENCVQYLMDNPKKIKSIIWRHSFYSLKQSNFKMIEFLLKNNVNSLKKLKKIRNGYSNILE